MEGLLPLIYRTIKRKKSRRYYRCLSSGDAAAAFGVAESGSNGSTCMIPPPETHKAALEMAQLDIDRRTSTTVPVPSDNLSGSDQGRSHGHHRRYASLQEFSHASFMETPPPSTSFSRARSHRVLSCISGG
ncbi:unnamed protein product [Musa textilis]